MRTWTPAYAGVTWGGGVIPSEDGIQACPSVGWDPGSWFWTQNAEYRMRTWIPAFAGMTAILLLKNKNQESWRESNLEDPSSLKVIPYKVSADSIVTLL